MIPDNRRVLTPPPFAMGFQTGSWTYRASYLGIRPSEREAYHPELVPKLRRRGVLQILVMVRVYKVYITALTYKLWHACFRLYIVCISDYCMCCSVDSSGMDVCVCEALVKNRSETFDRRLFVALHCCPSAFRKWNDFYHWATCWCLCSCAY